MEELTNYLDSIITRLNDLKKKKPKINQDLKELKKHQQN